MIQRIEHIIRNEQSHFSGVGDAPLRFLKYSTPSLHGSLEGKVVFLVFVNNAAQPSFVVKAVRIYESKYVVENAYRRLVHLHTLISGTPYAHMFPQPLYLYDDGKECAFSIETHIEGVSMPHEKKILQSAVREYTAFQKSIYKHETFDSAHAYAKELTLQLGLEKDASDVLAEYSQSLSPADFKIPRLPQHGDLTEGNVMVTSSGLRVIDCDSFGSVELAGYDVYRFVTRCDPRNLFPYLDDYFKELGVELETAKALLFLYYLHDLIYKKAYILEGKTAEQIISDFVAQTERYTLRVLQITRMNYFSNKSHVYTTARTAEAMHATDGIRCVLVSTDDSLLRAGARNEFLQSLALHDFPVYSLPVWGAWTRNSPLRVMNWLETFFSNIRMAGYVLSRRHAFDVLYFRDATLFLPILLSKYLLHKPLFMESHAVLHAFFKRHLTEYVARRVDGIISISAGLKEYYDKINPRGLVSFCSASDPEQFSAIDMTQDELRETYGLPKNKIILGYVGNLSFTGNYDSYGFEDVIRALPLLSEKIILIGIGEKLKGETRHLTNLAQALGVRERVLFLPRIAKSEVASYLRAFDILVHPKAGAQIGNSPAKLFEWLLAGRPIVAAHTRAIAEILEDGKNALLVSYTDPVAWKRAVERMLGDATLTKRLVNGALLSAKKYTWSGRGQAITHFITTTLSPYA